MRNFRSMVRGAATATATAAATVTVMTAAVVGVSPRDAGAQQAQPAPKHHSKIKGAVVGGAAGAVVGHPKLGAAAGAMHQHNKNKKAAG